LLGEISFVECIEKISDLKDRLTLKLKEGGKTKSKKSGNND
jgi:hypothetical protein